MRVWKLIWTLKREELWSRNCFGPQYYFEVQKTAPRLILKRGFRNFSETYKHQLTSKNFSVLSQERRWSPKYFLGPHWGTHQSSLRIHFESLLEHQLASRTFCVLKRVQLNRRCNCIRIRVQNFVSCIVTRATKPENIIFIQVKPK